MEFCTCGETERCGCGNGADHCQNCCDDLTPEQIAKEDELEALIVRYLDENGFTKPK